MENGLYEQIRRNIKEISGRELSLMNYFRAIKNLSVDPENFGYRGRELNEYWFSHDESKLSDGAKKYLLGCVYPFVMFSYNKEKIEED